MSQAVHYETPPQDRVPLSKKLIYGLGAFVNNLLAAAIGGMSIVLNLGLGMNPALVGLLGALPRLIDAFTDPLMGYVSDHTRSRWGRRRPYIFAGAIAAGVIFALLWQLPEGKSETYYFWFFLIGSLFFYLAYTIFATPWVALGYELTPDYHERTRVMAVQNFMGQLAYLISPWFLWVMQYDVLFDDLVSGARALAIIIGVTVVAIGILPAIFLTERFSAEAVGEVKRKFLESTRDFFRGFAAALKFSPFFKLCLATFLVFNGFMMVASFQAYVIIYYSTGVSMAGYALKWVCYSPQYPLLLLIPAPLIAFGLGGLFTLMGSMIADVCDMDELESHERREGMFGSIYWWVVKLGMAAALAIGGILLNATGFDVALGGDQTDSTILLMRIFDIAIPLAASAVAIWMVATYPITEQKAHEVRLELERRRGPTP
jgi:GPH family glycoside/pentoside/hexuronide:cation symporter